LFEGKREILIYILLSLGAQLSVGAALFFQSKVAASWHNNSFAGYVLYLNGSGWMLLSIGVLAHCVVAIAVLRNRPKLTISQSRLIIVSTLVPLASVCFGILEDRALILAVHPLQNQLFVLELVLSTTIAMLIVEYRFNRVPLISQGSAWLCANLSKLGSNQSPLYFALLSLSVTTIAIVSSVVRHPIANLTYDLAWYTYLAWLLHVCLFDIASSPFQSASHKI